MDCVRFARLGLIEGFEAELVVSGINHGSNLGDDITYSGTVAAAFEAIVLGIPGIAVSQQSDARELDFRMGRTFGFDIAARFVARIVEELERVPLPEGTLLNINVPAGEPRGRRGHEASASACTATSSPSTRRTRTGNRTFWIYGGDPSFHEEPGTDLSAVAAGRIAVTPVHFDLTDRDGMDALRKFDLAGLLRPAAREVE